MDRTDFLLDAGGDLKLDSHGDFVIGFSDEQHIEDILDAYPGEYPQSPLTGVYIQRAQNGLIDGTIRRDIKINLQSDGYQVNNLIITETEFSIDAIRNDNQ